MSIACVYMPGFELQVCAQKKPSWRTDTPAAVVSVGKRPIVRSRNRQAARGGVRAGMSLVQAQSFLPSLQWTPWRPSLGQKATATLTQLFSSWSPRLYTLKTQTDCFWLDARGLVPLYDSLTAWATQLHAQLTALGWVVHLAVAKTSFDAMILARHHAGVTVVSDTQPIHEHIKSCGVHVLGLDATTRRRCQALGVTTLGQLFNIEASERERVLGDRVRLGARWCQTHWRHRQMVLGPQHSFQSRWCDGESVSRQAVLELALERTFKQALERAKRMLVSPSRCLWRAKASMPDQPEFEMCLDAPGTSDDWSFWQRLIQLHLQHAPWGPIDSLSLHLEAKAKTAVQRVLPFANLSGVRHQPDRLMRLEQLLLETQHQYDRESVVMLRSCAHALPEKRHQEGVWHPGQVRRPMGVRHLPGRVRVLAPARKIASPHKKCHFDELCAAPWWQDVCSRRRYGACEDRWVYIEQGSNHWHQIGWR